MIPTWILKSNQFQAFLDCLFSTIGEPQSSKFRTRNRCKLEPFMELDKTSKSCSGHRGGLALEIWSNPKSNFVRTICANCLHAALEP